MKLAPAHPLIEPAIGWLALNRRGTGWENTRDTAFAVFALTRHLAKTIDSSGPMKVEIGINGSPVETVDLSASSILDQPKSISIPAAMLQAGVNQIQLDRDGAESPVYATALATAWAEGDAIKPFGHLVNLTRELERQKLVSTLLGTARVEPAILPTNGSSQTGEQVRVKVKLTVPHDLHYTMIKEPRPAGCEPLNPLSGWDATLTRIIKSDPTDQSDSQPL